MNLLRITAAFMFAASLALLNGPALADPLPGEVLKFEQLPLNNGLPPSVGGAPYLGHDEFSTAYPDAVGTYSGNYVADDFADNFSTPVVHVQWWGSYLPNGLPPGGVQQFLISFESDVPAVAGAVSHPGSPLLNQIVTVTNGTLNAGSGNFTETLINGNAPEHLFQYNAELKSPFAEVKDTVYWLKIVALVNPATQGTLQWGWHNRDYAIQDTLASPAITNPGETNLTNTLGLNIWHFQDDAVADTIQGIGVIQPGNVVTFSQTGNYTPLFYHNNDDGPVGISGFSEDLAFRLFTTPEPSSVVLMGLGSLALILAGWRRRRVAPPPIFFFFFYITPPPPRRCFFFFLGGKNPPPTLVFR